METAETVEVRVLDAAERLFYGRGLQAVGMDTIRAASGVSLKRLYQVFSSKDSLVEAYLRRRDRRWRAALERFAGQRPAGRERILAVFDWLHQWFQEPDFRGCAFVNSYGELGAAHPGVADAARAHKDAFRGYLAMLVAAAGAEEALTDQLVLLAEGAITTAAISGSPEPALHAREAARALLGGVG
ncbi:TetR/AcrR family transcriptional regulator [Streptomyces sp. AV19]|uniref:TetR/AcrR family transcriptional regulator n=1 Tax=Streptomyces sp. AV19 TaxID=2793068 RepID=UPI0018FE1FAE|nr:TetR/AcrR family transcriptional regulator [Streptomyces sp. AV19]MBH1934454.1 TetR/AcrR family transcriptional regulator [Streptomyces sp. AV19]MDG4533244.1 TetR/AcrR family transcriptional regulator [Streptomyces sp. AV19]